MLPFRVTLLYIYLGFPAEENGSILQQYYHGMCQARAPAEPNLAQIARAWKGSKRTAKLGLPYTKKDSRVRMDLSAPV
jgi:hypothetical protein